jgi:hypothetical protein
MKRVKYSHTKQAIPLPRILLMNQWPQSQIKASTKMTLAFTLTQATRIGGIPPANLLALEMKLRSYTTISTILGRR